MSDIGQMAWSIRDDVSDLCQVWLRNPSDRSSFGNREFEDLRAAYTELGLLLSAVEAVTTKEAA